MTGDIEGEIYYLDKMLTALVELLEEKGILEHDEWENKLREKLDGLKMMTDSGSLRE